MLERFIMVACNKDIVDHLRNTPATTDYTLLHAKDGREAFGYLELYKGEVDLAIVDLGLLSGRDLDRLRNLANQKQTRPLRVIAMEMSGRLPPSAQTFVKSFEPPRSSEVYVESKRFRTSEAFWSRTRPESNYNVPTVVVSFQNPGERVASVITTGDTLFKACSNALDFFSRRKFWKGPTPTPKTVLEVSPVGGGNTYRVRVATIVARRSSQRTGQIRQPEPAVRFAEGGQGMSGVV